jgi:hypothetical protein
MSEQGKGAMAAAAILIAAGGVWMIRRDQGGARVEPVAPSGGDSEGWGGDWRDPPDTMSAWRGGDALVEAVDGLVSALAGEADQAGGGGSGGATSGPLARLADQARQWIPPALLGGGAGGDVAPLLDYIGGLEAPQGYDQVSGLIPQDLRPAPGELTRWTVADVLAWQDRIASRTRSTAAGRYQIIRSTLRDLARDLDAWGWRFDREGQDRLAVELMKRRGLDDYQAGRITAREFGDRLAREWAALPVLSGPDRGRSYYAGDGLNRSLASAEDFERAISRVA